VGRQLKIKQDHHAVQSIKVLQIEAENVKALYRRGLATVALLSMNESVSSKEDLIKAAGGSGI